MASPTPPSILEIQLFPNRSLKVEDIVNIGTSENYANVTSTTKAVHQKRHQILLSLDESFTEFLNTPTPLTKQRQTSKQSTHPPSSTALNGESSSLSQIPQSTPLSAPTLNTNDGLTFIKESQSIFPPSVTRSAIIICLTKLFQSRFLTPDVAQMMSDWINRTTDDDLIKYQTNLFNSLSSPVPPSNGFVDKLIPIIESDIQTNLARLSLSSSPLTPPSILQCMPPYLRTSETYLSTSSYLLTSFNLSNLVNLTTVTIALDMEAAKLPLSFLTSISSSTHAALCQTVNSISWLLDESKISRVCASECINNSRLLEDSIYSLATAYESTGTLAYMCKTEMKNELKVRNASEELPPPKTLEQQERLLLPPTMSVLSSISRLINDSNSRLNTLLTPIYQQHIDAHTSNSGGTPVCSQWPEGVPIPVDVYIPRELYPIDRPTLDLLLAKSSAIIRSLNQYISQRNFSTLCLPPVSSVPGTHTDIPLYRDLQYINSLAIQALHLELAAVLMILKDDELTLYNMAVQKALKKKKNISSKLTIGKPLIQFMEYIFKEISDKCPTDTSQSDSCPIGSKVDQTCNASPTTVDLLSPLDDLLVKRPFSSIMMANQLTQVLTPVNQGSRRPKIAKGAIDIEPRKMVIREGIFSKIRNVFERYGAVGIDTPVFELKETLMGKYGEDQKLIFELKDQGGEQLSLRYDLTVPFARYVASQNVEKIKRYHIGKVYRRDEPQMHKGRFREFYQCDFDIAGEYDPMVADAEVLGALIDILTSLSSVIGPFEVRLNHRGVLDAIMGLSGVPKDSFRPVCSSIDKLDKLSWEEVKREMCGTKGLKESVADSIGHFVQMKGPPSELLERLVASETFKDSEQGTKSLEDLRILFGFLSAASLSSYVSFDLSLARGLDYYTGVIFEAVLVGQDLVGSIGGGGRYDKLVGMFSGKDIPAVGVSIGVERLFRIVELSLGLSDVSQSPPVEGSGAKEVKKKGETSPTNKQETEKSGGGRVIRENKTDVLVCSIGNGLLKHRIKIVKQLRDAGICAEFVYSDKVKLGKQMTFATDKYISFAVIFGEDEINKQTVKVRKFTYNETNGLAVDSEVTRNNETKKEEEEKEIEVSVEDLVGVLQSLIASTTNLSLF